MKEDELKALADAADAASRAIEAWADAVYLAALPTLPEINLTITYMAPSLPPPRYFPVLTADRTPSGVQARWAMIVGDLVAAFAPRGYRWRWRHEIVPLGPRGVFGGRFLFGTCEIKERVISIYFPVHESEAELIDTVLHEIAHAILGPRANGHGRKFWRLLRALEQGRTDRR